MDQSRRPGLAALFQRVVDCGQEQPLRGERVIGLVVEEFLEPGCDVRDCVFEGFGATQYCRWGQPSQTWDHWVWHSDLAPLRALSTA